MHELVYCIISIASNVLTASYYLTALDLKDDTNAFHSKHAHQNLFGKYSKHEEQLGAPDRPDSLMTFFHTNAALI